MCAVRDIEISSLARIAKSKDGIEDWHTDDGERESEDTLPTDHLDRNDGMLCHNEFF